LSGSTSNFSLTATLLALSHSTGTAAALASSTTLTSRKSEGGERGRGCWTRRCAICSTGKWRWTAARRRSGSWACVYPAWASRTSGVPAQHAYSHSTSKSHSHSTNASANDGELDAGRGPRASTRRYGARAARGSSPSATCPRSRRSPALICRCESPQSH
jgi:hypothetical protein